ncbi:hypothetical protein I6E29_03530 [Arcanobacterium haemolyticum]|nr:hypothetical protein [Arcanobacterium haemolyticum]
MYQEETPMLISADPHARFISPGETRMRQMIADMRNKEGAPLILAVRDES